MKREMKGLKVVLVEDKHLDVIAIQECFQEMSVEADLIHFPNSESAIAYLNGISETLSDPVPDLILVSHDIPVMGGLAVLKTIRKSARLQMAPVIMFSSADKQEDVVEAYRLGANSCIQKLGIDKYYRHLLIELVRFWTAVSARQREQGVLLNNREPLSILEVVPN